MDEDVHDVLGELLAAKVELVVGLSIRRPSRPHSLEYGMDTAFEVAQVIARLLASGICCGLLHSTVLPCVSTREPAEDSLLEVNLHVVLWVRLGVLDATVRSVKGILVRVVGSDMCAHLLTRLWLVEFGEHPGAAGEV